MTWQPDRPYNDLPTLPPPVELETRSVLKAAIEARSALTAMDQAARRMPNPSVLLNTIPVLEAQASSEIENIVTTTDELFRDLEDPSDRASSATKETLRYRAAIFAGARSLRARPLSATTAVEVCSMIEQHDVDVRDLPGTMIANPVTRRPVYTPPDGEGLIRDLLDDWATFIHRSSGLDPLVVMAVAHYQFEAIHPFADGNGRTGRILNILFLMERELLHAPVLYLSRSIIQRKDDYYRLLLDVTRSGGWEEWILFMLATVQETATATVRKIDAIQELQADVREQMRALGPGANADLLDLLFEQVYLRIGNVVARCRVSRPTASKWLNQLVDAGVLSSIKWGRDRLFINARFLEVLVRDEPSAIMDRATLF